MATKTWYSARLIEVSVSDVLNVTGCHGNSGFFSLNYFLCKTEKIDTTNSDKCKFMTWLYSSVKS